MDEYSSCILCPRMCKVDRGQGGLGFCGQTSIMRVAAAVLHFGEEPPVTGRGGSGTVFFSGCTLQCFFCQNHQLSRDSMGREVSAEELADIFLRIQNAGAENVNLVTATQFLPGIESALSVARKAGFSLPLVWNTSGFERKRTVERLNRIIDIYLPDLKTVDRASSMGVYGTPSYASAAAEAAELMIESKPLSWEGDRLRSGVIVRHMVLPGMLEITRDVLEWFARHGEARAMFSLLFQYTPVPNVVGRPLPSVFPRRGVNSEEYETVLSWLDEFGIEEGFVQELEDDGTWFPDFSKPKPFPSGESEVIWHWSNS